MFIPGVHHGYEKMDSEASIRMSMDIDNMKFDLPFNSMTKVYCRCGRIIGLDSGQMELKKSLNKNVECIECRNARISREIEELNVHFDGTQAESF